MACRFDPNLHHRKCGEREEDAGEARWSAFTFAGLQSGRNRVAAGWRKSPADWRAEKMTALIAREAWIIEGVGDGVGDGRLHYFPRR